MEQKSLGTWNQFIGENDYRGRSKEEKTRLLYEQQVKLLDTFLDRKAITPQQYETSLRELKAKMGF